MRPRRSDFGSSWGSETHTPHIFWLASAASSAKNLKLQRSPAIFNPGMKRKEKKVSIPTATKLSYLTSSFDRCPAPIEALHSLACLIQAIKRAKAAPGNPPMQALSLEQRSICRRPTALLIRTSPICGVQHRNVRTLTLTFALFVRTRDSTLYQFRRDRGLLPR